MAIDIDAKWVQGSTFGAMSCPHSWRLENR